MSGGVDSAVTALLCQQAGYDAAGCTMRLWRPAPEQTGGRVCGSDKDVNDARAGCEHLGIAHTVLDFGDRFEETVIRDFIEEYQSCRTPNPCTVCNRCLKFGALLDAATEQGFDKIATGHYARIEQAENGRYLLKKAADPSKDQTYFLWQLTQEQLSHTLFPLGSMTKAEARAIAEQHGLVNAHKSDSQDICFVPDGAYARFIWEHTGHSPEPGDFIDMDGCILGRHGGIECYTIGQRKGIGLSGRHPYYVVAKNANRNTVMLGEDEDLFRTELYADDVNWIAIDELKEPLRCAARTRYHQAETPCTVYPQGDRVRVVFDSPIRAITAGQAVVFYDGDIVVGGGCIL